MGYNPAGNTTTSAGLTHLATVYYNKTALDTLRQTNRFLELTEPDMLPKRSGKTVQWFRYNLLGPNTTPHSEGTVGTSLSLGANTVSATIQEYADFISLSSLLVDTAIDPIVDNAADILGYRASISVDQIVRTEFDVNSSVEDSTIGPTFTVQDIRAAVARLKAANVQPKSDGLFRAVIHPYITFDLQADNTAGGFIDLMKYADPQRALGGSFYGEVGKAGGARIFESTNVKTSGTAPDVLYWCYIVGKGAVGAVSLAGSGPSRDTQSFRINVIPGGPSQADPEGMIGSYVSYLFRMAVKTLDSTNYRYRMVKANASLI